MPDDLVGERAAVRDVRGAASLCLCLRRRAEEPCELLWEFRGSNNTCQSLTTILTGTVVDVTLDRLDGLGVLTIPSESCVRDYTLELECSDGTCAGDSIDLEATCSPTPAPTATPTAAPTRCHLEITSIGVESFCVSEVPCDLFWVYRLSLIHI